jgi:lysyl-tRNA synthetase class 2
MDELNDLLLQRRAKLEELRGEGVNPYANDFAVTATSGDVVAAHGEQDAAALENCNHHYALAGRMMARRDFGKAAFIQIQDRRGRLQVFVRRDNVGEEAFQMFRKLDIGDIVGVTG